MSGAVDGWWMDRLTYWLKEANYLKSEERPNLGRSDWYMPLGFIYLFAKGSWNKSWEKIIKHNHKKELWNKQPSCRRKEKQVNICSWCYKVSAGTPGGNWKQCVYHYRGRTKASHHPRSLLRVNNEEGCTLFSVFTKGEKKPVLWALYWEEAVINETRAENYLSPQSFFPKRNLCTPQSSKSWRFPRRPQRLHPELSLVSPFAPGDVCRCCCNYIPKGPLTDLSCWPFLKHNFSSSLACHCGGPVVLCHKFLQDPYEDLMSPNDR